MSACRSGKDASPPADGQIMLFADVTPEFANEPGAVAVEAPTPVRAPIKSKELKTQYVRYD